MAPYVLDIENKTTCFLSRVFFVFGTMGIYGSQVKESGNTGFLGFLLITISNYTLIGQSWLAETEELASLITYGSHIFIFQRVLNVNTLSPKDDSFSRHAWRSRLR